MTNRLAVAIAVAALVPISAGLAGVLLGPGFVGAAPGPAEAASHFRYLSGLLLGIGLGFWWCAAALRQRGAVFSVLCAVVVTGGLGRLLGMAWGLPPWPHLLALGMELLVTPALWLAWRAASQTAPGGR